MVGCGRQGQLHIEVLQQVPGFSVRAVCDLDAPALEQVRSRYAIPHAFSDFRQLLAQHKIDLVVVCTMPNSHCDVVVAALGAGAHVLCEKPVALDRHEAARMVRAAARAGRMLTAGFNLRYSEVSRVAKSVVANGQIGKPLYARARSRSGLPGWGLHHVSAISGGGALAGSGVHAIDLACWAMGTPRPLRASGSLGRGSRP